MKRTMLACLAAAALCACGEKKDGHVSNAATRYAEDLRHDTDKARAAADKANAAIAEANQRMEQAQGGQ